jgi:hypothetical protein
VAIVDVTSIKNRKRLIVKNKEWTIAGRQQSRGRGETGRRSRLKICFLKRECGFESRRPHQITGLPAAGVRA